MLSGETEIWNSNIKTLNHVPCISTINAIEFKLSVDSAQTRCQKSASSNLIFAALEIGIRELTHHTLLLESIYKLKLYFRYSPIIDSQFYCSYFLNGLSRQ